MLKDILAKLSSPIQKVNEEIALKVADSARIGARAALLEVPMLDALLDGEPCELLIGGIVVPVQLRKAVK